MPYSVSFIVLVVLFGAVWLNHQRLEDWWKLRNYTPPSSVVALASEDTMNAYTRHMFYLNKPQLLTTVSGFRKYCPENEDTIVLGCYHPGQNGIFVYAVQDASLAGIQQVTAAHEVLHAVYSRLSSSERSQLDSELQAYFEHGLTDPTVKAEVSLYQKTEPTAVYDEMSCTFGTEIANLPTGLNDYYMQFFGNRQKIVGYEQQYQVQFTNRQQRIATFDAQLGNMKTQIDTEQSSLTAESNSLDEQKVAMQQLLNSNQLATYNDAVDSYNAQVNSYNLGVAGLKQEISTYNQLVATRNSIAGQLTTLDSAIDTRVQSATSS